jgi:acetyltransferase-like isoleucine patch superfamily enzyme
LCFDFQAEELKPSAVLCFIADMSLNNSGRIHDKALVEPGAVIGAGTRVWAFVHILPGARIGADCNICDQVFIENDVVIGDRVTIKCGVQVWDGVTIENDCFLGPNATLTNDKAPRSKVYPEEFRRTLLKLGASVGANATLLSGITIGRWAMIGAGAVVTRDVPDFALIMGNPGRVRGFVCRCSSKLDFHSGAAARCACGAEYRMTGSEKVEEVSR